MQLYLTIKNKDVYAKGFSLVEFAPGWSFGDGMIRQHDVTWEQRTAMNRFGFLRAAGAGHGTSSPATFIHLAHHNAGVARHSHVHGMRPQDAAVHLGDGKRIITCLSAKGGLIVSTLNQAASGKGYLYNLT